MATPFDATGKDLIELGPADWLAFLGQPRPPELVRVIDADLSATVSTSTDKVIRVDDPEPWLVLVELQAAWDGDLPFDLLRRYGLLKHRHRLPVSCVVVLLRPEANTSAMTGTFAQPDRLGRNWSFPFHVVRVWETPAATFLRGPLALIPLAPVANVDQTDVPSVLSEVKGRAYREATRSHADTLWAAAIQLLALRYDEDSINRWEDVMATLDISKTPLANMFRKEGRVEGRVEEAREGILTQGTKRFGAITPEAKAAVGNITDLARLHALRDRLLDVNSWQELLAE
jgi:hypothetical protein